MASDTSISQPPLDPIVESVLCALDRWTARNDGHHTEKRSDRRHPYRAQVRVTATDPSTADEIRFSVVTRDISVSGLSFVVAKMIRPDAGKKAIHAPTLLLPEHEIVIEMPHGDTAVVLTAEVRRVRKVHDDLYECGVRFVGRRSGLPAADEPTASAPASDHELHG